MREIYLGCHLDIQPCRSKRSCLKYVSKEDCHLLTNVKTSLLHFNYQCFMWASSTSKFDCTDSFVVSHCFQYHFLERYLQDFQKRNLKFFSGLRKYEGQCFDSWMLQCVEWFKNVVYSIDKNLKIYKRKQLFIYGPTNVGKSSLIEKLIGKCNMKYVYYPGVGKFFMQTFDPFFHKVVIFEEFNYRFYQPSFLKRLLENRVYSYPVKCSSDNIFAFNGPIIFVSNEDIRDVCQDEALLGRLLIVNAYCQFWQAAEKEGPIIKEESLSSPISKEVSYQEISSSEESL